MNVVDNPNGRAIYLLTNEKANAVVAVPIGRDGLLSGGSVTSTGGGGANGLNAKMQPAAPDPLFSQSSLTVAGDVSSAKATSLVHRPSLTRAITAPLRRQRGL